MFGSVNLMCLPLLTHVLYGYRYWRLLAPSEDAPREIVVNTPPIIVMLDDKFEIVGKFRNTFNVETSVGIHHVVVKRAILSGKPTKCGHYFEYEAK